jgi:hypothetical protein
MQGVAKKKLKKKMKLCAISKRPVLSCLRNADNKSPEGANVLRLEGRGRNYQKCRTKRLERSTVHRTK